MTSFFKKKKGKAIRRIITRVAIVVFSALLVVFSLFASYIIVYKEKIYPNISVAGINVSGSSLENAITRLSQNISTPENLTFKHQDQTFILGMSEIDFSTDFTESAIQAYKYTRSGDVITDFGNRIYLLFKPREFGITTTINEEKLDSWTSIISGQISISPIAPSIEKLGNSISVNKGVSGSEVNQNRLKEEIKRRLSFNIGGEIEIPVDEINNTLSNNEAEAYLQRAEKILGKSVIMKFEYNSITLKDTDIFEILDPEGDFKNDAIDKVLDRVAKVVERPAQNPKFVFEGGKVSEFQPALDGIKLDRDALRQTIKEKLNSLEKSSEEDSINFDIPVVKTPSEIETSEVNDFGIKELVGRGTSTYYHSIPGRIHNVALAASRINGTLIKPGDTFSFNSTLGDVSSFTGYKQAYIISEGKTILGDGGGVCQVSSTLFRAVLNAGLPIVERQAHAYRVGYYEQGSAPGFDATVYSPSPDFKFTNDTGSYILIEAIADTKNYSLIFELYGTKDGRISSVSKPVITNVSAPPSDIYQDDPSLPIGTTKQIDYKAWGAKVTFKYVVTKNGKEIINKTFVSNYKPWAAVYLRGMGPATQ